MNDVCQIIKYLLDATGHLGTVREPYIT